MTRVFRVFLFLCIFMGLTIGLHYYLFTGLISALNLPDFVKTGAMILLFALGIHLVAMLVLSRFLSRRFVKPMAWVGYTWMGMVVFLCLTLSMVGIFRLGWLRWEVPNAEQKIYWDRMFALVSLAIGCILSLVAILQATKKLKIPSIVIQIDKLPASMSPFRLVQLTDLHIGPTLGREWLEKIVRKTNELNADLIAITGDLVDGSVDKLASQVAPLAMLKAKHGVFFVTGNHEYYSGADAWIAELGRLGIKTLRNESVLIAGQNGEGFDLIGVDDYHSSGFAGHGPNLPLALQKTNPSRAKILLAHQPAAVEEAATLGIDLQISGHTHGGQFWPWNYFVRLQQPYVQGLHKHKNTNTQIYISSGTGYWGPPMRLGTTAEITNITLFREDKV